MVKSWIGRLKEVDGIRGVGAAKDLAGAKRDTRTTPYLFCVFLSEKGQQMAGVSKRTPGIAVVYAVSNSREPISQSGDELQTIRNKVQDKILGWTPEGGDAPARFKNGYLESYNTHSLWWVDVFEYDYFRGC